MIGFILAILSFACGWLIAEAYPSVGWHSLGSYILCDLFFIWLFSEFRVDYVKQRWICCLLTISVFVGGLFTPIAFVYEHSTWGFIEGPYNFFYRHFDAISIILSTLVVLVSATPRKLLYVFDRIFWPGWGDDICRDSSETGYTDTEGRL